jgi:protein-tyrosine-phosphatase
MIGWKRRLPSIREREHRSGVPHANQPASGGEWVWSTMTGVGAGWLRGVVRAVLPQWARAMGEQWLLLPVGARGVYARRAILRTLGIARPPRNLNGVHSVLFVCHGNIIRSPLAEALFRKRAGTAAGLHASSAGLDARDGRKADERAMAVARDAELSLVDHRARRITEADVRRSDLVAVMDFTNEAKLLTAFPWAQSKTILLGACRRGARRWQIPDPYSGSIDDVGDAFRSITESVDALIGVLRA